MATVSKIKTPSAIEPVSLAEAFYQLRLDVTSPVLWTGALTIGSWYRISATQTNWFYTGCAIGDVWRATAATALSSSNKVQEIYEGMILDSYIKAARVHVENLCGPLISQSWYQYENTWPLGASLWVGKPRLLTVASVKYTGSDTVQSTLPASSYMVDIVNEWKPRIVLNDDIDWPTAELLNVNPIVIEFTCGYGSARTDVPETIRAVILMRVSHMFENRSMEIEMPRMLDDMLLNYRSW